MPAIVVGRIMSNGLIGRPLRKRSLSRPVKGKTVYITKGK